MNTLTANTAIDTIETVDTTLFITAIEKSNVSSSTKKQYTRAIERAVESGVDLFDASKVADYAQTLPSSSRSFLRGAIRMYADEATFQANNMADDLSVPYELIQRRVSKLLAVRESIKLDKVSGQKAHIWLTANEVVALSQSIPLTRIIKAKKKSEVDETVTCIKGYRDKVIMGLLVGAGLRRDELANLTWGQIIKQGERTTLDIVGKGKKKRAVPISGALVAMLEKWKAFTPYTAKTDYVLSTINRGDNITKNEMSGTAIYGVVGAYGAMIDQPELQPHDLRRTYAQLGYNAGIPVAQISVLLGHSSITVTEKYLSILVDTKKTISDFVPFS